MMSCGCGTIESGPQRMPSTLPERSARVNTRTTCPTKTTIITTAHTRWISVVISKPPTARASAAAQPRSENSSGRPVSAQPTKVSIRNACITRSIGSNRR